MKLVKYFLQKKSVTVLLLILVLGGGLFSYIKMGKLEDAPFTIKQALVMTPYPGASPSEVQSQVTDVLEESIQSLGELYYLKTENRAGLSKITVYVRKKSGRMRCSSCGINFVGRSMMYSRNFLQEPVLQW